LLDVIAAWVNIVEPDAAAARMAAIKEKIGETYFAWSGPTEKGSAVYFRVQGPAVVIEYAPQGGTDHIHTVIRNPEDDYGAGSAVDRLAPLLGLAERPARLEPGGPQQPADGAQLRLRVGHEAHLVALLVRPRLGGPAVRVEPSDVAVAPEQRRQLLDHLAGRL